VPLLTEAAIAGQPVDLRVANTAAQRWCAEVNAALHSEISAVPDERLADERQVLGQLPSLRPELAEARRVEFDVGCPHAGVPLDLAVGILSARDDNLDACD
jgi:hypothetical protein